MENCISNMFCSFVKFIQGPASRPVSSQSLLGEESRPASTNPIGSYSGGLLTHNGTQLVFTGVTETGIGLNIAGTTSGGKPHSVRRGPGRPRKELLGGSQKKVPRDNRVVKRVRGGGAMRGMYTKRKATPWINNLSTSIGQLQNTTDTGFISNMMTPSPLNEDGSNSLTPTNSLDQESLSASFTNVGGEKLMQPPEEPPYFPEKWPGKVCALCCLGERSQLGQGEMLRIEAKDSEAKLTSMSASLELSHASHGEDKSLRGLTAPQLSNRRQKGLNKCK